MKLNKKDENKKRLETLYRKHHRWLIAAAKNISKNGDVANDLVGELYLYLAEKCNSLIWYEDSFNLLYCHTFLKTRWINKIKVNNKHIEFDPQLNDSEVEEYDIEFDQKLERAYNEVEEEIQQLQKTRMWAPAKIAELYLYSDKTLEGLAKEIGISKSTCFLNVKKIKLHLKKEIKNPFEGEE